MRDRARRDECVIRARRGLTPRCAQCRRDGAKCPRTITIERKNIKVRLGLLQVLLTGTALGIVARYVRTHGKLGERYRANNRFIGKLGWVGYLAEEDHRRGVQHPLARRFCHSDGSIRLSMSRRSASGLTCGKFLRRRMSSAGPALDRGRGRSSATGAPSRVTTMRSPCSTRRRTSPPLFRRSRTVTVSMGASVSPVRRWCELRSCPTRASNMQESNMQGYQYRFLPRIWLGSNGSHLSREAKKCHHRSLDLHDLLRCQPTNSGVERRVSVVFSAPLLRRWRCGLRIHRRWPPSQI